MKRVRLKCQSCGKEQEFQSEREAYLAGWDLLQVNKKIICTCDKCPSAPNLFEHER